MHIAPWAEEPTDPQLEPILKVLRGDFFCMPFGGNAAEYNGEHHPIHGETANREWSEIIIEPGRLVAELRTEIRPARVTKEIVLREGETNLYQRHRIADASGPMSFGYHAMLRFRTRGRVSLAPFAMGQVYPGEFEVAAAGGYSSLLPGAEFDALESVPSAFGGTADLSRYPAREGFEDLVMVLARQEEPMGWSTVTFPEEGYAWFQLKNTAQLTGTVLWHSNGGRHYSPWSGRHRGVLGIEEVTSYIHTGIAESVGPNPYQQRGFRTCVLLDPEQPTEVSTVFGVVEIPAGFERVAQVERTQHGVALVGENGHAVPAAVDLGWLGLS